jgi:hypothetical protein
VSAETERLTAAQAKADRVIRAVAEPVDSDRLLRVAVTDVETGQRLATGFVTYETVGSHLRLVGGETS